MRSPTLEQIIEEGRAFRKDFVSQRIKRGIEANAFSGLPSGPVPLGYRLEIVDGQRRVVIAQTVAPLVRDAFHLAATGKHSIRELVAIMTGKGLRSRHGKPLQATGLWRILTNPFYCGRLQLNMDVVAGRHEPIVDTEMFDQIQRMIKRRHNFKG